MIHRAAAIACLLCCLTGAAGAEESFAPDKKVEADVSACLTDARTKAPDNVAHDRRVILATTCICNSHKELCRSGMPQDGHLRERVSEDK
ncbi:MAG TPA: hypothetical protein VM661_04455 [Candidatus Sulfotelmatobacter sp.]|jgi:hypothetical protein|nr:hypothetical protein [Candidatus Sulfotelmatobacter sp.]